MEQDWWVDDRIDLMSTRALREYFRRNSRNLALEGTEAHRLVLQHLGDDANVPLPSEESVDALERLVGRREASAVVRCMGPRIETVGNSELNASRNRTAVG